MHTCGLTAGGTIACWGDDSHGQLTPPDFAADFTMPSITVPTDMTVDATGPGGAVVAYTVTATDNIGVTSQHCAPASGTLFPIGATTVRCTAADAAGNAASASFAVTVKGAPDQMTDLGATVEGLDLQQGTETSLKAKLEAALAALAAGNKSAACGQLDAMVNQINANVPTRISRADADALIGDINRIQAATGC
jgi:hypothetical protein